MLGNPHETLHQMFREGSTLFAHASQFVFDDRLYDRFEVSEENTDVTEYEPVERRVDTLLRLTHDGDEHLAIVEAQIGRDEGKRARWPYYIAYLNDKYRRPVTLLVVCNDAAVAKWAREPIEIGPDGHACAWAYPHVLGPDNVPMITDLTEAVADVEFAVLSALIHSKSEKTADILNVLAPALASLDIDKGGRFAKIIAAGLGTSAAREYWRNLMIAEKYEYQSELTEYLHAEGRAAMLLDVLRARGIDVSSKAEERILSCKDNKTLTTWAQRAATADSLDEVFS